MRTPTLILSVLILQHIHKKLNAVRKQNLNSNRTNCKQLTRSIFDARTSLPRMSWGGTMIWQGVPCTCGWPPPPLYHCQLDASVSLLNLFWLAESKLEKDQAITSPLLPLASLKEGQGGNLLLPLAATSSPTPGYLEKQPIVGKEREVWLLRASPLT